MRNVREILSKKILDVIETLPRFRGGVISHLQDIREHQQRRADNDLARRQASEGVDIKLRQVTTSITFEYENFTSIQVGLKKVFPKNEEIFKFVGDLKRKENNLHALGWSNLGFVADSNKGFIPSVKVVDEMPNNIEYISLSYYRILPSVACLVFEFKISDEFSNKLDRIQRRKHLPPLIFKRFWPLTNLHRAWSMGGGKGGAFEAIEIEKDGLKHELLSWISKRFRWNGELIQTASFVDVYEINGNPTEEKQLEKWLSDNRQWLMDYGISTIDYQAYSSAEVIYGMKGQDSVSEYLSDTLTRLQTANDSEFGDFLEYKARAVSVASALRSLIDRYRDKLESLRESGFKSLHGAGRKVLKKGSGIQELKKLVTLLSRLEHEVEQSSHWIIHSISEIGPLSSAMHNKEIDLGNEVLEGAKYQLSQIKQSAEIIDLGLTNYLSVQNIYVMHKLQRWMFILSIVVTIATIVGVISGWNDLKDLINSWLNA